jgi:hypothetical protein
VDLCSRLINVLEAEDADAVVVQALWASALVTYTRCFETGKRPGIDRAIFHSLGFEGDVDAWHGYLKDMRDKHVAHSVNPFEIVRVGVLLTPSEAEHRVAGVAVLHSRHIVPDLEGVMQMQRWCLALKTKVGVLCEKLRNNVLAEAEGMDVEVLYARPTLRVTAPGPEEAGSARRRPIVSERVRQSPV